MARIASRFIVTSRQDFPGCLIARMSSQTYVKIRKPSQIPGPAGCFRGTRGRFPEEEFPARAVTAECGQKKIKVLIQAIVAGKGPFRAVSRMPYSGVNKKTWQRVSLPGFRFRPKACIHHAANDYGNRFCVCCGASVGRSLGSMLNIIRMSSCSRVWQ